MAPQVQKLVHHQNGPDPSDSSPVSQQELITLRHSPGKDLVQHDTGLVSAGMPGCPHLLDIEENSCGSAHLVSVWLVSNP